jgi:hypothetical protein
MKPAGVSAPGTHLRDQLDGQHGEGKDEDDDGEGHESGFFVFFFPLFLDLLGRDWMLGDLGMDFVGAPGVPMGWVWPILTVAWGRGLAPPG